MRTIYPQKADFTFYGGIYRNVYLIRVPEAHFALGYYGGNGIKVTPEVKENDAAVTVEGWTENAPDGTKAALTILDAEGNVAARSSVQIKENCLKEELTLNQVHLWDGKEDPYLYTLRAELLDAGNTEVLDSVELQFGCRTFFVDPQKGFLK